MNCSDSESKPMNYFVLHSMQVSCDAVESSVHKLLANTVLAIMCFIEFSFHTILAYTLVAKLRVLKILSGW